MDADQRKRLTEVLERTRDKRGLRGGDGANAQDTLRRLFIGRIAKLRVQRAEDLCTRKDDLPGTVQRRGAPGLFKQGEAQALLDPTDLAAHRRLRQADVLAAEAKVP